MKNQKGISIVVLIVTIIAIILLSIITLNFSTILVDDSIDAKKEAEISMDNDKIREIITYEIAGTEELIDAEIDLKRIALSDTLKIEYSGEIYGENYTLYLSEKDIKKVEAITGKNNYFKPYKDITKSYIVKDKTEEFIRLEEDWKF